MATHYTDQPADRPHRSTPQSGAANNVASIFAMVLGVIGLLFLPVVIGLTGVILAIIAKTVRHERLSTIAIVVSTVGMVGGMILGAVFASM
ncbi:hypothetical protein RM717_19895 [Streptomyces griseus]|uniref:DUF4190 domain-containing protein n=2 Tax=Streptomycetaceae TaxID=2062 RepID=A0ABU2W4I0_9ACTN|nr:hypothetical protein [Streptomyces griseus]ARF75146.1 hypothetical protein B7C62_25065 [Kitasatospora albolonga]MDT0492770.1 hypothetical protein [Streptomyces griseus]